MNKDFTEIKEEKVIELMLLVLNFDQETELNIINTIEQIGIRDFLFNIDVLDFPDEIKEKVNALKVIIQMNDNYSKDIHIGKGGYRDDK